MENDRKNINIQIGKRLREARTNMNIDKSEFARVLDVTEEHYRKLEAGATGLSADKILILYHTYEIMIKQDFVFQFRKNHFRVNCADILYFEKKGRQAVIHTVSDVYKTNMTIEELWKQLDKQMFSHIHVSYIINLSHIRSIEGDEVVLDDGERFLIARSHKQSLKEKHLEYMRRMV